MGTGKVRGGKYNSKSITGQSDGYLGIKGNPYDMYSSTAKANPHYKDGIEYTVNCQRVVCAYELLRRGYDVEALPNDTGNLKDRAWASEWRDSFERQYYEPLFTMKENQSKSAIEDKMKQWGEGSRGIVYVAWKNGSSHVFNVEYVGGQARFFDGQSGRALNDGQKYFNEAIPSRTMISRVDNLKPNDEVMRHYVKKRGT